MKDPARYDLAGIGSMVVDHIRRVGRFADRDQKVLVEPEAGGAAVQRLVGGVTLNHLGWASVLGLRVAVFGKQADDENGRLLREGMARVGIRAHLDLSGSLSSSSEVYVDARGDRAIYMTRGATADVTPEEISDLHRPVIERAATVSTEVSQLPLPAARRVLEIARRSGARTVVDLDVPIPAAVPALGTQEDLEAVLRTTDVLKPSRAACRGLARSAVGVDVASEIGDRFGCAAVVLTDGPNGCAARVDGSSLEVPACDVRVVDTTGAGDAFLGGLLAGLHHGLPWEDALRLGNACGACCCERIGAFPGDVAETRARVLELYGSIGGASLEIGPVRDPAPTVSDELGRFLRTVERETTGAVRGLDRAELARAAALVREAEAKGGRLHVTGVGKPEHLARYAAGLLSSTGTPATYLDATEAVHGSVGQLREEDLLLAISNSGETPELLACVDAARGMGARVIAVCARAGSPLGRAAEVAIRAGVEEEGGPLGLAPRGSFLAEAVALQALSVLLQEGRGLTPGEYQRRHPAGALGRRAGSAARSDRDG